MSLQVERVNTPEERAAALNAAEREVERDKLRAYVFAALACFGYMALGLVLVAFAVHTTDESLGQIAFWSGLLLGNAGILITVVTTHQRAEAEGWL
jgi:hypothetical protein